MVPKNVALVSTVNDVDGRLSHLVEKYSKKLLAIFGGQNAVSVTQQTSKKTVKALEKAGFNIFWGDNNHQGGNYRGAIKGGLATSAWHLHLTDMDRALHWAMTYPDELAKTVGEVGKRHGLVLMNRSKRAFATHPIAQTSTETLTNKTASDVAGFEVDLMSGSYPMDRKFAEIVVRQSKRDDQGIYAEIFALAVKNKVAISAIEVEGLEWETPDRFQSEIKKNGYKKWLKDFMDDKEWERRLDLLEKSLEVLLGLKKESLDKKGD